MYNSNFDFWRTEVRNLLYNDFDPAKRKSVINDIYHFDYENKFASVHIDDINLLHQVIGALKSHFTRYNLKILFRGQRSPHEFRQLPTLFRKIKPIIENMSEARRKIFGELDEGIRRINLSHMMTFYHNYLDAKSDRDFRYHTIEVLGGREQPDPAGTFNNSVSMEAVLAHYQYNTRWIDLVDNLNIALWFSAVDVGSSFSHDHTCIDCTEDQTEEDEEGEETGESDDEEYSYLFLYGIDATEKVGPGIFEGKSQRLVNLREAINHKALRPLVQHGYSLTDLRYMDPSDDSLLNGLPDSGDLSNYVLAIIRLPRNTLLKYLFAEHGDSFIVPQVHDFHNMFPPVDDDKMRRFINIYSESFKRYLEERMLPYIYNLREKFESFENFKKEELSQYTEYDYPESDLLQSYRIGKNKLVDMEFVHFNKKLREPLEKSIQFRSEVGWEEKVRTVSTFVEYIFGQF